ncbi:Pet112p [Malassezia vespertilionis]|uniref:Pet112p n=1 Tax=Malassezia vespertilionis TaxID=2020962 RepID=A0A2N1JFA4_9BASI|nr:Pet112p [Malassezia vespertilionis]
MPRIQDAPVNAALNAALALGCTIAPYSTFDRKHYFYADLAQGYQITQQRVSIRFEDGYLKSEDEALDVPILHVQLEQDTAKLTRVALDTVGGNTHHANLLDFNRAGVALIEIVSAPVMHTPEQAGAYVRKVRDLLRCVGASDGNMNEGSLRCDANVSIHKIGTPFGVRCEIKNVNSVKFMMQAIAYEIQRQYKEIASGKVVHQESRGFDEASGKTYSMRSKELAEEYRYMPELNLGPLYVDEKRVAVLRAALPELPDARHARLRDQYGLSIRDVNVLTRVNAEDDGVDAPASMRMRNAAYTYHDHAVEFFEVLVQRGIAPQAAVNWTIHHLLRQLNAASIPFKYSPIPPSLLADVIELVEQESITAETAQKLLGDMVKTQTIPVDLREFVARHNMAKLSEEELHTLCANVIADHPKDVEAIRNGKSKAMMKLVGAAMRSSNGRADAQAAAQRLQALIEL